MNTRLHNTNFRHSIIQDCEDSLTNWVEQNAAVSSKLSTRTRTLSQRRRNRHQGEAVDLAGQDAPMENRESGLWIPAEQHHHAGSYEDDEEEEEDASVVNGSVRGRDEERIAA